MGKLIGLHGENSNSVKWQFDGYCATPDRFINIECRDMNDYVIQMADMIIFMNIYDLGGWYDHIYELKSPPHGKRGSLFNSHENCTTRPWSHFMGYIGHAWVIVCPIKCPHGFVLHILWAYCSCMSSVSHKMSSRFRCAYFAGHVVHAWPVCPIKMSSWFRFAYVVGHIAHVWPWCHIECPHGFVLHILWGYCSYLSSQPHEICSRFRCAMFVFLLWVPISSVTFIYQWSSRLFPWLFEAFGCPGSGKVNLTDGKMWSRYRQQWNTPKCTKMCIVRGAI